jgi:hypothetical protein
MNRYALEMHALEKHQNFEDVSARILSLSLGSLRRGFLSRQVSRPNDYQSEATMADSMTFMYELRCDLIDVEFDEILPLVK